MEKYNNLQTYINLFIRILFKSFSVKYKNILKVLSSSLYVLPSGRSLAPGPWPLSFPSLFFWLNVAWNPVGTPMVSTGNDIHQNSSPSKGRTELRIAFWLSCHTSLGIPFFLRWVLSSCLSLLLWSLFTSIILLYSYLLYSFHCQSAKTKKHEKSNTSGIASP